MSVSAAAPTGAFFALRPTSLLRARVRTAGPTTPPQAAPAIPSRGYFQSLSSRKSYTIDEILALRADDTLTWGLRSTTPLGNTAPSSVQTELKRTKLKVKISRSMEGPISSTLANLDPDSDTTVTPLSVSQNRWRPQPSSGFPSTLKKLKGILNKLTVDKFDQLALHFVQLVVSGCPTLVELREAVQLVFDKALDEMTFSDMYTRLVMLLSEKVPAIAADHGDHPNKKATFKSIMLSMCQSEFEKAYLAVLPGQSEMGATPDNPVQAEMLRLRQRQRLLGNMKFVGELFNKEMLTMSVIVYCSRQLTSGLRCDHLEAVCALLEVTGAKLDSVAARSQQTQAQVRDIFQRLTSISNLSPSSSVLDSRTRFLIREILELRSGGWVPRRKKQEAMKIDEFRAREEPFRQQLRSATLLPDEASSTQDSVRAPVQVSARSSRTTPRYLDRYARPTAAQAVSPVVSDSELAKKYNMVVPQAVTTAASVPASAVQPGRAESPVEMDAIEKGVSSMVREFMRIADRKEALLCMEELDRTDNTLRNIMIVTCCLNEAMEANEAKERANAADLIVFLVEKALISSEDAIAGLESTLELLPNIIVDLPVAPSRFGELLSVLVKKEVVPESFVVSGSDELREQVFALARS